MIHHKKISDTALRILIRHGKILMGGNIQQKIYGILQCRSGKKMKKDNRVFFGAEQEAIFFGYRPCGHCMRNEYRRWKKIKFRIKIYCYGFVSTYNF